jgi:hypothetical protein
MITFGCIVIIVISFLIYFCWAKKKLCKTSRRCSRVNPDLTTTAPDPEVVPDPQDSSIYTSIISDASANTNRVTFSLNKPPTYHEFDVSKLPSYLEASLMKRNETLPVYELYASKTTSL